MNKMVAVCASHLIGIIMIHAMEKIQLTTLKPPKQLEHPTYQELRKTFLDLPIAPQKYSPAAISLALFKDQLQKTVVKHVARLNKSAWVNGTRPPFEFMSTFGSHEFHPFSEKKQFSSQDKIGFKGDIHGAVHSLIDFLDTFREHFDEKDGFVIKNPNFCMSTLGDYVDRGGYGIETLYLIMRLWEANPEQFFPVRGNHESIYLNTEGGFLEEFKTKYGNEEVWQEHYHSVRNLYHLLPVVVYIYGPDNKVIACCHGGLEMRYHPGKLLLSKATHHYIRTVTSCRTSFETIFKGTQFENETEFKEILSKYHPGMLLTLTNGFMWSDFKCGLQNHFDSFGTMHERLMFGKEPTEIILKYFYTSSNDSDKQFEIMALFRGHQHSQFNDKEPEKSWEMEQRILNIDKLSHPDDVGVGKLWVDDKNFHREQPGSLEGVRVVTFAVSPDIGYKYPKNYFALLTLAAAYKDWKLKVYSTERRSKI
jgi:hypothetical protein